MTAGSGAVVVTGAGAGLFSHQVIVTGSQFMDGTGLLPSGPLTFDGVISDADGLWDPDIDSIRIPAELEGPWMLTALVPFTDAGNVPVGSPSSWNLEFFRIVGSGLDAGLQDPLGRRSFGRTGFVEFDASSDPLQLNITWVGILYAGDTVRVNVRSGFGYPTFPAGRVFAAFYLGDKLGVISTTIEDVHTGFGYPNALQRIDYDSGPDILGTAHSFTAPPDPLVTVLADGLYLFVNAYSFKIYGSGWTDAHSWDVALVPSLQTTSSPFTVPDSPNNIFPTQTSYGWADLRDCEAFDVFLTLTSAWLGRLPAGSEAGSVLIFDTVDQTTNYGQLRLDTKQTYMALFKIADTAEVEGARVANQPDYTVANGATVAADWSDVNRVEWDSDSIIALPELVVDSDGLWLIHAESTVVTDTTYDTPGSPVGGFFALELLRNGVVVASRPYDMQTFFGMGYDQEPFVTWVGDAVKGDAFTLRWVNLAGGGYILECGFDSQYMLGVALGGGELIIIGGR